MRCGTSLSEEPDLINNLAISVNCALVNYKNEKVKFDSKSKVYTEY